MRQSRRGRRRAGGVAGDSGRRGRHEDAVEAAVGDVKRDPICAIVIVVRAVVTRAAPCAGPIRRESMMSAGAVSPPMWWAHDETVHVCTIGNVGVWTRVGTLARPVLGNV